MKDTKSRKRQQKSLFTRTLTTTNIENIIVVNIKNGIIFMHDTPETDSFVDEEQIGSRNIFELYSLCRKLEMERNQLKDIIKRASAVFCEEGQDSEICAKMFKILTEKKG